MFFAIELQTSGVYLLSQGQGLFKPSKLCMHKLHTPARRGPVGRRRRRTL